MSLKPVILLYDLNNTLVDEAAALIGHTEVKSRIRRLQMEASRRASEQGAAGENVAEATAIITNPTHFAVALKYVPGETRAPIILAMGRGFQSGHGRIASPIF